MTKFTTEWQFDPQFMVLTTTVHFKEGQVKKQKRKKTYIERTK